MRHQLQPPRVKGAEMTDTTIYTYTVVIEPDPDGGFITSVPMLPGCVTCGDTVDEASEMAEDAIAIMLVAKIRDGKFIDHEGASCIAVDMSERDEVILRKVKVDIADYKVKETTDD